MQISIYSIEFRNKKIYVDFICRLSKRQHSEMRKTGNEYAPHITLR